MKLNESRAIMKYLVESNANELASRYLEILKSKLSPEGKEYVNTFIAENSIDYHEPIGEDPAYIQSSWNTPAHVFMSDYGSIMLSDLHYTWFFDENNIEDASKWVFKRERGPYYNPTKVWNNLSLEEFDKMLSSLYRKRQAKLNN